ncbi:MAG TPA: response regulator [Phycisphaerales bacterium]|nr:response regulator [Phycisphaerales bacterium]
MSTSHTILVIEDEQHIAHVVKYNLERENYTVYLARDGVCGLKLTRELLPDMVLLDWMLPEADGLEVLTELMADERTRHIPVVMMTARGAGADADRAAQLGAAGYITKPFDNTTLLDAVRERLSPPAAAPRS